MKHIEPSQLARLGNLPIKAREIVEGALSGRRRALIVVACDLFDAGDETLAALTTLRAQRHDVSVLHVLDPHERNFPYDGLTQFESLETTNKMLVNPAAIKKDYLARMD